jgi:hypothetical protein
VRTAVRELVASLGEAGARLAEALGARGESEPQLKEALARGRKG